MDKRYSKLSILLRYLSILIILIGISIISISIISAGEGFNVKIRNGTIIIEGFITSEIAGKVSAGYFERVNETIGNDLIICDIINLTESNTTIKTNCTLNINYEKEVIFQFNKSVGNILGDIGLLNKYEDCIDLKKGYEIGMTSCIESKNNLMDFEKNYSECSSNIISCKSEKSTMEKERNDLKAEAEEKKNLHWIWGIGGLIIGVVSILYREGKIFGHKSRKPEDDFNPHQAA